MASIVRVYSDCREYIESAADTAARIVRIKAIIVALEEQMYTIASDPAQAAVQEYSLDTGQSKIKTVHRTIADISTAIDVYDKMLVRLVQRTRSRTTQLIDKRNIRFDGY
jgi:hypothetical protein